MYFYSMKKIRQLPLIIAALSILLIFESCDSADSQKDSETGLVTDGELNLKTGSQPEAKLLKDIFKKKSVNNRDLAEIKESSVLRVVTLYSSTGYFLYRGQTMGFEFELLENLAEHLNLELQIIVAKSSLEMVELLHH